MWGTLPGGRTALGCGHQMNVNRRGLQQRGPCGAAPLWCSECSPALPAAVAGHCCSVGPGGGLRGGRSGSASRTAARRRTGSAVGGMLQDRAAGATLRPEATHRSAGPIQVRAARRDRPCPGPHRCASGHSRRRCRFSGKRNTSGAPARPRGLPRNPHHRTHLASRVLTLSRVPAHSRLRVDGPADGHSRSAQKAQMGIWSKDQNNAEPTNKPCRHEQNGSTGSSNTAASRPVNVLPPPSWAARDVAF
jgi:hypothetical protein